MSSGHDEYWSARPARERGSGAREAGVNLAFFSGNEIFWKTRWGPSTEGSNTPYRTLTTYKETHFERPVDPEDPPTWTGAWRDPRFSPPGRRRQARKLAHRPAVRGQRGHRRNHRARTQYAKMRLWRNTAVAKLTSGKTLTLAPGTDTLGYEWDEDRRQRLPAGGRVRPLLDDRQRPADVHRLRQHAQRRTRTGTHHLTLYRAPSGALVFGAGTVQWSWGLANINAWGVATDRARQEGTRPEHGAVTVNLLAEMGAQPGTLKRGSWPATKSTDTTPPTSTITSPTAGAIDRGRQRRHDHRHRDRHRRRRRGRGRSVDRRRRDMASGDAHDARTARR